MLEESLRVKRANYPHCLYCKDELEGDAYFCECGTPYHKDCSQARSRCDACGSEEGFGLAPAPEEKLTPDEDSKKQSTDLEKQIKETDERKEKEDSRTMYGAGLFCVGAVAGFIVPWIVDNGPSFHSTLLDSACLSMGFIPAEYIHRKVKGLDASLYESFKTSTPLFAGAVFGQVLHRGLLSYLGIDWP